MALESTVHKQGNRGSADKRGAQQAVDLFVQLVQSKLGHPEGRHGGKTALRALQNRRSVGAHFRLRHVRVFGGKPRVSRFVAVLRILRYQAGVQRMLQVQPGGPGGLFHFYGVATKRANHISCVRAARAAHARPAVRANTLAQNPGEILALGIFEEET